MVAASLRVKKKAPKEGKKGAPAYMVSFGDMMTLILCFFILLVSMATEQNYGLLAKGVGSFIVAVRSFGMNGVLSGQDESRIFEQVRRRFNLPPEEDPDRREAHLEASHFELVRAKAMEALQPQLELSQPEIAAFGSDSSTLSAESQRHIDRLAATLRPSRGQTLVLEGHARDAAQRFGHSNLWLASARAQAVRDYLIEKHAFKADRIVARGWLEEVLGEGPSTRSVDARLVSPNPAAPR
jgi:chemotaxis protein MotB